MSHPIWVRGLKHVDADMPFRLRLVAPHMGAWIETKEQRVKADIISVAPHMGAWIETFNATYCCAESLVAPHMGAWIETLAMPPNIKFGGSHPIWVRGLKLVPSKGIEIRFQSHPIWVRGLKLTKRFSLIVVSSRTPYGCVD